MSNSLTIWANKIKQIPLKEYLSKLGYHPMKENEQSAWYLSPFREEAEASFKVNKLRNLWYDFGSSEGGEIIKFEAKRSNRNDRLDLKGILQDISDQMAEEYQNAHNSNPVISKVADTVSSIKIKTIQPIQSRFITKYLEEERKIPVQLARKFLKEAYYSIGEYSYFAAAFENDRGGLELRNPKFKGTVGHKSISFLPRNATSQKKEEVTVFEGVFDFLSALVYYKVEQAKTDTIILNGTAQRNQAIQFIKTHHYKKIFHYLDHDRGGEKTREMLLGELEDCLLIDQSSIYQGFNDFNEFLINTQRGATQL